MITGFSLFWRGGGGQLGLERSGDLYSIQFSKLRHIKLKHNLPCCRSS